ncbi:ABC transporter permease [Leifsonia sp. TF02-11]|uniref:ABC transporter permease n=1 Tax=Leifsonia sp. TF02-11 TaxID=2815212 RepID=UPI001AA1CAE1|nr:ABC transporter permease [Leifsonia sp. TF02-11]MBO1740817.1 FtsX-like permease family protein [Leifsonia sp. TF02-11]
MSARGLRQLFAEGRRYAVAASALTAGVALLFGTLVTSASVGATLRAGVDALGGIGQAGVVSTTAGAPFSENDAAAVADMPGVALAIKTFSRGTTVRGATGAQSDLTITGYSTELNARVSRLASQGRLPSEGKSEALLPADIAQRLGVSVGDTIAVAAVGGRTELDVVGIADPRDLGVLAYDNIFVSLTTAQELFHAPDEVTRVDLTFSGSADAWKASNAAHLPAGTALQDTSAVTSALGPLLTTITLVLVLASIVTVAVSAVLIAVALGGAIRARSSTYAVMRAVGASGKWLASRVLAEAAVLSLVCSTVGIAAGFGVSALLSLLLTANNGLPFPPMEFGLWEVALALITGLIAGLAGAARSIVAVLNHPPIATITGDDPNKLNGRVRIGVGIGLMLPAMGTLFIGSAAIKVIGLLGLIAASMLLAPTVLSLLARIPTPLSWPMRASARRLQRSNPLGTITSMTAAIVSLGLALVIGVSAVSSAMTQQISRQFGADVQVTSAVPLDDGIARRISGVAGVEVVSGTVVDRATFVGSSAEPIDVSVLGVDPDTYFTAAQLPWNEGDDRTTPERLRQSAGVVLPVALAKSTGTGVGARVAITRGAASEQVTVVGTFDSLVTGTQVLIPISVAHRLGLSGETGWNISVSPGSSPQEVRDAVADQLGDIPGVTVITGAGMRDRATTELAAYAASAFSVVLIAFGLGSIGISGVMAFSVHRRRAEFGALRAIGARRRGVAGLVLWDAIYVSTAALIVGLSLGQVAGALLTEVIAGSLGVSLQVSSEPGAFLLLAAVTFAFLTIASIGPARRASRVDPLVALAAI